MKMQPEFYKVHAFNMNTQSRHFKALCVLRTTTGEKLYVRTEKEL